MVFSWKNAKKRAIKSKRKRVQIYLKNGRTSDANKLKQRIVKLEDALS